MYINRKNLDKLDLRDESTDLHHSSASDVLQHIEDKELFKLLKVYGKLGTWSKFIVQDIIEARYMFHRFETIQVRNNVIIKPINNANPTIICKPIIIKNPNNIIILGVA